MIKPRLYHLQKFLSDQSKNKTERILTVTLKSVWDNKLVFNWYCSPRIKIRTLFLVVALQLSSRLYDDCKSGRRRKGQKNRRWNWLKPAKKGKKKQRLMDLCCLPQCELAVKSCLMQSSTSSMTRSCTSLARTGPFKVNQKIAVEFEPKEKSVFELY